MELEIISLIFGGVGSIATVGSLFYAWKNDQFLKLVPKDKELASVLKGVGTSEGFVTKLHSVLQRNVTDRRKLKSALAVAKQMHFAKPMDEALIEINKRALELGDIEFAYKVATNAFFAVSLDEMLMNIVDASLKNGNHKFANKAANRMYFAVNLDNAKKKIIVSYDVGK
ncbi:hypothetical protein LQK39_004334 [Vibrio vulnificus]|nr:hypothetical protein [Vibrio vulnificus]EIO3998764.1 hypothetical protein [Vibrio vulnificus]